jgi:hypothetical protein
MRRASRHAHGGTFLAPRYHVWYPWDFLGLVEDEGALHAQLRAELSAQTAPAARERARAKLLAAIPPPLRPTKFSGGNISVNKRLERRPDNSKRIAS